jgi:hypothetical protein
MKINRILRLQLIASLILAAALLAGCAPRDGGSNRSEGMDGIPLVSTSQLAVESANPVAYQIGVQYWAM